MKPAYWRCAVRSGKFRPWANTITTTTLWLRRQAISAIPSFGVYKSRHVGPMESLKYQAMAGNITGLLWNLKSHHLANGGGRNEAENGDRGT